MMHSLRRAFLYFWLMSFAGAGGAAIAQTAETPAPDGAIVEAEQRQAALSREAVTDDDVDAVIAAYALRVSDLLDIGESIDAALAQDGGSGLRARQERLIREQFKLVVNALDELRSRIDENVRAWSATERDGLVEHAYQLRDLQALRSQALDAYADNLERAGDLELDVSAETARFERRLTERARTLTDDLETMTARLEVLGARAEGGKGESDKELASEIEALEIRHGGVKQALEATIELLRRRGVDTSEYVQALVRNTGQLSIDAFDSRVLRGLFDDWVGVARDAVAENGPRWLIRAILFIVIVAGFLLLSKVVGRVTRRVVGASRMRFSELLQNFFVNLASGLVLVFGLLIALAQIGIELGPLLAGFGIAGLIVGFALQDTLSNFASGLMILIYRPFDVGDVVEAGGVNGKVSQMNLVSTTIITFDNQVLVVPNNKIWGDVIRNVNAQTERRVDLTFGIGYDDDIAEAESILRSIIAEHELILETPEPTIKLHTLGESSVDFIVRPWVKAEDYWTVYWDVTRRVKERFDEAGVSIPFPQRDVHVYEETPK